MFSDFMAKKQEDILAVGSQVLWKNPSKYNWKQFSNKLKGNATYYRVVFEQGKIKKNEDITKSFVEIRNSKRNVLCKVPLFVREGNRLRGATIYLESLQILEGV